MKLNVSPFVTVYLPCTHWMPAHMLCRNKSENIHVSTQVLVLHISIKISCLLARLKCSVEHTHTLRLRSPDSSINLMHNMSVQLYKIRKESVL